MTSAAACPPDEERLRPLYARILRLRHVDPGGMLCFVYFEGTVAFGLLLALAELVNWWGVLVLPATVAVMVKVNDAVAAAVLRSAARVPAQERDRFRREIQPAIGRASVPRRSFAGPGSESTVGAGKTLGLTASTAGRSDAGEIRSGGPEDQLATRFIPLGRPLSMTALVRARLEFGRRGRLRPDRNAPDRAGSADAPKRTLRPRSGLPQGRQAEPAGSGRPRNSSLVERMDQRPVQRPVQRWLVRLDSIDTARQSATRRYE